VRAAAVNLRLRLRVALLALSAGLAAPLLAEEVVVVVSATSTISELSESEIADIYLGRLGRLGKTVVTPLDQPEGSAARNEFYREFTGKSPAQVKALWSKLIFTGRGRPPRTLANDREVLQALRDNPDAIGYMRRSSVDSTARILR
jgi:ABC-type phosphate transport system substrate-binding protein